MSQKDLARRSDFRVCFAGVDITKDIRPYLISITYTDAEEDEADDLQIQLHDRDQIWQKSWLKEMVNAAASTKKKSVTHKVKVTETYTHRVNCSIGLYCRSGPGMGYSPIGAFAYNARVRATGKTSGSWTQVEYGDKLGWSWTGYLTKISGKDAEGRTYEKNVTEKVEVTGMSIQAVILRENWKGDGKDDCLDCGQFELDAADASGPPDTITIKATALPYTSTIRQTKKSRGWEAYTLSGIANEMARKNSMACLYSASNDPYYKRVEQNKISDIKFLSKLCKKAGISLKVSNNILVLFDQAEYEAKSTVRTFRNGDGSYTKKKLSLGKADSEYSSCRVRYTPPKGKLITATAYIDDYDEDADTNQQLEITAKVRNTSEALALAKKMLRMHNKYERTASFTIPGDPAMLSGVTVKLSGWGPWDGKHIISKATHRINNSGYVTMIETRKAQEGV